MAKYKDGEKVTRDNIPCVIKTTWEGWQDGKLVLFVKATDPDGRWVTWTEKITPTINVPTFFLKQDEKLEPIKTKKEKKIEED
jgi:hypothetical protein